MPAHAHNVVTEGDGQVQGGTVLIMALDTNRFVFVLMGPAVHGLHELGGNALAAVLRQDAVEPAEVDRGLQFEAQKESDVLFAQARNELQDVVTAPKATPKRLDIAGW